MTHLTLAGVSGDGKRLRLVDETGAEFTVDITPRLRAELCPENRRNGQLENQMDSSLRPRDIQARIRSGETPEAVATAAGTSVEKIMAYVGPVLAEREHMAQRAQRSSVRRRSNDAGQSPQARILGDAVAEHLRSRDVDPDEVEWDSSRREDGRWRLTALFATPEREGTAEFTFDARGNYVVLDNEDAQWLVGDVVDRPAAALDEPAPERRRRLTAIPGGDPSGSNDDLPLGDDAIELVTGGDPEPADAPAPGADEPTRVTETVTETVTEEIVVETRPAGSSSPRSEQLSLDAPLEAFLDDEPASDDPQARQESVDAQSDDTAEEPEQTAQAEPEDEEPKKAPARRPVAKKRGRASVPSWDEIMFGGDQ